MESSLVAPRIRDALRLCRTSSMPKFVGFLRPIEAAEAENIAKKEGCNFEFFGGYEGAERTFFCAYPDWCEDRDAFCPVEAVTFSYRKQDSLSHRDFLGALMSLGITRESVGDILIEESRAVVFLSKEITPFVLDGIKKISNVGVTLTKGVAYPLPQMRDKKEITDTVASLRLDCVVAALLNCSRSQATELISQGLVFLNSISVEKSVKTVAPGDIITVRGKGKFKINSALDRTKKGRIVLKAEKYV